MHARTHTHTHTHTPHITSPTNTPFVRVNIINRVCFQPVAHKSRNTWNGGIGGGGGGWKGGGHTSLSYAQEWKHKELVQTCH